MPDRPRRGPEDWEPSYPEFAVDSDRDVYADPQTGGADYIPAPATSHVYGFRLKAGGFVRKFLAPSYDGAPAGTVAILEVAFKPPKPKGATEHPNTIASEYSYFYTSEDDARAAFDALAGAAHPGEVVKAELIDRRVPYKKIVAAR